MSVGENIRKRRTALGITQMKLAEAAMVSHPMIVAYERGTKNPSLQVAFEISKALDCTLEDLLDLFIEDFDIISPIDISRKNYGL